MAEEPKAKPNQVDLEPRGVRIAVKGGYTDRWGNLHKQGEVAILPGYIAEKLITHRIAVAVDEEEPSKEEKTLTTASIGPGETAAPRSKKRGRPRKAPAPDGD